MIKLLLRLGINSVSLYAASLLVPGIHLGDPLSAVFTAVIFGVVNTLIKPLVSLITCLLQMITLGLFTLVINALMLMFTAWAAQGLGLAFYIDGFLAAFFGAMLISIVSTLMTHTLK
ncbi:MAG: hypothetical protein HW403_395 [Dehalococcoidia bacterium]|nr:hypothetical protein [Dehalococcoidia bacterium]